VQIEGQTVTDSMYHLEVGPKPVDFMPAPLPDSPQTSLAWPRQRASVAARIKLMLHHHAAAVHRNTESPLGATTRSYKPASRRLTLP